MGNTDYLPGPDAQFENFAKEYAKKVSTDFAILGVPEAMSIDLTAKATDFENKMSLKLAASQASKSATEAKNDSKVLLTDVVRISAGIIQNNPAVTDEQKKDLGLPVHDEIHSVVHAHIPQNLEVTGKSTGVNSLKWKPGENKYSTTYLVQAMKEGDTDFVLVDAVDSPEYDHTGQKPGVMVTYQVKARHRKEVSEPSNPAIVYPKTGV
jgi:hypothetical protein